MRILPLSWWKLSARWFLDLRSRTPEAKKGLFRNSLKVSVIGLALSVGALSMTFALVTGFEWTLAEGISRSQGHLLHYTRWQNFSELEKIAAAAPAGVERAEFIWTSQALLVGPKGGKGVLIEGRRAVGTPDENGEGPVRVDLGKPLAAFLGVGPGDNVRVLLPGVLRGPVEARVEKLVSNGMYDLDSRLAIIHDESLRPVVARSEPGAFAKRPGDAHGIRFFMSREFQGPSGLASLEAWRSRFTETLKTVDPADEHPVLRTWKDQRRNLFGAVGHEKSVLSFVLSLLVLVAALNVAATLVVLFLERDREMAILQALGLSQRMLFQWVAAQGLILGLTASTLGLLLGRVFGFVLTRLPIAKLPEDIYNLSRLPLKFELQEQTGVFLFGIVASIFVAGVLGLRLSKINLVSVLGDRR